MSEAIEARVTLREARAIALDELRALDESALKLLRLEKNFLDPEDGKEVDFRQAQLEIAQLRTAVDNSAEGIATRLLQSFIMQLPGFGTKSPGDPGY